MERSPMDTHTHTHKQVSLELPPPEWFDDWRRMYRFGRPAILLAGILIVVTFARDKRFGLVE
jgi:hypothetical protein